MNNLTWNEALAYIRAYRTSALPEAYRVAYAETAHVLHRADIAVDCYLLSEWIECRDYARYDYPETIAAEYIELTS